MKEFKPQNFSIIAVDDNPINRLLIGKILQQAGYNHHILDSGEKVLLKLKEEYPDLILMDLMMPNIDGLELCSQIKSNPNFLEIPVIFLTASDEKEHILQAFNVGAVDYVVKPFNHQELLARIKTHLELKYTRDELKKALIEVEKLATLDSLTNISNRRHFLDLAEREFRLSSRKKRHFSILVIDIDHFKKINDTYGHFVGDEAIKLVAKSTQRFIRQEDLLARWGGEEFLIFLSETPTEQAIITAERIRNKIADLSLEINEKNVKMTVSIGVATYNFNDVNLDVVLKRGDEALYEAKNTGRNKVVFQDAENFN